MEYDDQTMLDGGHWLAGLWCLSVFPGGPEQMGADLVTCNDRSAFSQGSRAGGLRPRCARGRTSCKTPGEGLFLASSCFWGLHPAFKGGVIKLLSALPSHPFLCACTLDLSLPPSYTRHEARDGM